jgi:hypothetical protein
MYRVSENQQVKYESDATTDSTSALWTTLDRNFMAQKPFFEATINKWNEHTQMNQQLHSKNKKSAFNLSITDQVN